MNYLLSDKVETLIVGAGPAGLAVSGMLAQRGRPSLVLERGESIGTSWRRRYDALRLNSAAWFSSLPGLRIDRRHGTFPTRDQFVAYLEDYAAHFRLDVRCETTVHGIVRGTDGWDVSTSTGTFDAEHVVVATGLDNHPVMPAWPGRDGFAGRLIHACEFRRPEPFCGLDVLVVGCGNTGSEIAHLLAGNGAGRVRVAVRTPPNLMEREWRGMTTYYGALLGDHLPTTAADRIGRFMQRVVVGDLSGYGLPVPEKGVKSRLEEGIAPTVVDGFVGSVRSGRVEIVEAVRGFDGSSVVLADGRHIQPDVVIAATGYSRNAGELLGPCVSLDHLGSPIVTRDYESADHRSLWFVGYWAGLRGPLNAMRGQARRVARAIAARCRG